MEYYYKFHLASSKKKKLAYFLIILFRLLLIGLMASLYLGKITALIIIILLILTAIVLSLIDNYKLIGSLTITETQLKFEFSNSSLYFVYSDLINVEWKINGYKNMTYTFFFYYRTKDGFENILRFEHNLTKYEFRIYLLDKRDLIDVKKAIDLISVNQ